MVLDTNKPSIVSGGGLVRAREGAAILRVSLSSYWRYVQQGLLPRGIRLTARCTVWRVADIEAFVTRQAAKNSEAA